MLPFWHHPFLWIFVPAITADTLEKGRNLIDLHDSAPWRTCCVIGKRELRAWKRETADGEEKKEDLPKDHEKALEKGGWRSALGKPGYAPTQD